MPDDDQEVLQRFVDRLFAEKRPVTRFDAVTMAEAYDLPSDLQEIVALLPPGPYARTHLCDQLNSALKGHGWNGRYGVVD